MVTQRTPNKEWCRDWSQSRFGSALASFPLPSFSSHLFLLISFTPLCWNPFSASPSCLFIEKGALGTMAARPGELRLSHEVIGLPRRAGSFTLKSFGGPGKPEASLGELGSRKTKENTFLPSFFGIFHILDQNTEWSSALHYNCPSTP